MAREEEPREDLLREATALVERVELEVEGFDDPIVAGFRRDGAASFYFGQNYVYQFNTAGELRRAYAEGHLYKAEAGRLVRLTRQRTESEVQLLRHDCSATEEELFLTVAREKMTRLKESLEQSQFRTIGQFPTGSDAVAQVCNWLVHRIGPIILARSPRVL